MQFVAQQGLVRGGHRMEVHVGVRVQLEGAPGREYMYLLAEPGQFQCQMAGHKSGAPHTGVAEDPEPQGWVLPLSHGGLGSPVDAKMSAGRTGSKHR